MVAAGQVIVRGKNLQGQGEVSEFHSESVKTNVLPKYQRNDYFNGSVCG